MLSLEVDSLMGLMPSAVLSEYKASGDSSIFGFSPGVKSWLEKSTHPRVERWRNDLKRFSAMQMRRAYREQIAMAETARAAYEGATKSSIRMRAVIHPVIKGWMETKHGRHVWKDKDALADTERLQPKLFFNN